MSDRLRGCLGAIAVTVALILLVVVAGVIWLIRDTGSRDEQRPASAIVVLGAAQYDGRPSPVFAARLDHAVRLYEAGLAPLLVVTGGGQPGDRTTEAATGRAFALERGVPASAIVTEDRSRSTYESIRAVAALLQERGIGDALFVSDPTHLFRALLMARDAGLVAWGSPTPTSPVETDPFRLADAILHELGGLLTYLVFIRSGWMVP